MKKTDLKLITRIYGYHIKSWLPYPIKPRQARRLAELGMIEGCSVVGYGGTTCAWKLTELGNHTHLQSKK